MTQQAPYPDKLAAVVHRVEYKENWLFTLVDIDRGQGSTGLTLVIRITTPDSYDPTQMRTVLHYMIVPAAAYDERAWIRWVLDQILLVEQHEACEFFKLDGKRPFSPNHGPGRNPYSIIEKGTYQDAATEFTGEKRQPERKT